MTISRTAEYVTEHPAFKQACRSLLSGDASDMKILLIDLMAHVSLQQNQIDTRTFNKFRNSTHPVINEEMRAKGCDCQLNFKMQIPADDCIMVSIAM